MLVQHLHTEVARGEKDIALALPECEEGRPPKLGKLVNFYADHASTLDSLADRIEQHRALKDLVHVGRTKEVPEKPQAWAAYTRYRLPSRKKQKKDHDEFYQAKLQRRAESVITMEQLPVIFMGSSQDRSSRFGLGIKVIRRTEKPSELGALNGYGLSSRAKPVWLPVIE